MENKKLELYTFLANQNFLLYFLNFSYNKRILSEIYDFLN